ncbi:MAG: ATP-grasp domain-containing protein, partial [Candidatus Babeliales bacterium]|nr:ATP-grasp domain-containing protein [Candidatus Babeliales bacterium]
SDFVQRLPFEAQQLSWEELRSLVDFLYLAVHGRYAEDGTLQGFLEVLGIPYLGTKVFASALVMDKIIQRDFLQINNLDVAKAVTVTIKEIKNFAHYKEEILKKLAQESINFPVVVKPHKEGSSIGITVLFDKANLQSALEKACYANEGKAQPVLIEEKIEGMEFTCIILTNTQTGEPFALPITEIVPEEGSHFFNYEQKYMPGRATKITPARCSDEQTKLIQDTCIKAMNILGIKTIARIDGFLTPDNKVILMDPNTLTGMSPSTFIFRQAAEIDWTHTKLINHLIEEDLKNYKLDNKLAKTIKEQKMNNPKIRVAVLLGGNSNEKEISLESGRNIVYKISPEKYQTLPIFLNSKMELYAIPQKLLVRNSTKEIELGLEPNMKIDWSDLQKMADFVFIALHGGYGENGCIQGALEMLELPYNGSSVFASALCMDKYKTTQFLRHRGFNVPNNLLISREEFETNKGTTIKKISSQIPGPKIIKPHDDGCSVMVQKANNDIELEKYIQTIFDCNKNYALVEECIAGMELTVGVIGNDNPIALPPSQAISAGGILSIEEKFLPGAGENQTPAPISREATLLVRHTMQEIYKAVGCKGYARIDCFYQEAHQSATGKEQIVIIEINTLPGMTPATCIFHQAAEMDIKPMDFIDLIITLGFEEHQIQNLLISQKESVKELINKLNLVNKHHVQEL